MVFIVFGWFPWFFKVVSLLFYGFWLVSIVFKVFSWYFMVFGWFPWFFFNKVCLTMCQILF